MVFPRESLDGQGKILLSVSMFPRIKFDRPSYNEGFEMSKHQPTYVFPATMTPQGKSAFAPLLEKFTDVFLLSTPITGFNTDDQMDDSSNWYLMRVSKNEHVFDMENWMGSLKDETSILDINIPGTHDSGAYGWNFYFVQTQQMDITGQLQAGIRFFDLRAYLPQDEVGFAGEDQLKLCHGQKALNVWLRDVFQAFYDFLKAHPAEFLVVMIKDERDLKDPFS